MSRPPAVLLAAVCVAAVAACGGAAKDRAPGAKAAPAGTAAGGCRNVARPSPKAEHASGPRALPAGRGYTVALRTSCGDIEIRLATARAPKTASSFASLVRQGFYDGLAFHRVVRGFVIQGGDPKGTGLGGPGYQITEKPPSDLRYTRGTVAMAKTEADPPGVSGSQFFVVTAPDAGLPPDYALVGRVSAGMDVVDRIDALRTDASDRPQPPVVIEKATLQAR